jgi:SCP-2 sterol transfer family
MPTAPFTSAVKTVDPVSHFFTSLAAPGHIATFEGESATLRFDVLSGTATERWYLAVNKGNVAVSRQNRSAEAIVRIDKPCLEEIVTGRMNAQASLLRGLLACEGSMSALMMFQRCLPGPPGSTGRAAPISSKTVMAQRRPT